MRRWLALLAFALGSLGRRRARSASVAAALALVAGAFASAVFLTDALRDEARREVSALPDVAVSRLRAGRPSTLTVGEARALEAIPGVASVRPRVWGYLFVEALAANFTVVGLAPDGPREDLTRLVRGRAPAPGARGWVVLGEGAAGALGLAPGLTLVLSTPEGTEAELRVVATFAAPSSLRTADVALVDERDARALLGLRDDEATDLAVTLTNPDESRVVAGKLTRALRGARVLEKRLAGRAYDLTYDTRGGLVLLALLPSLLALLVLAWDRATGLSSEERREVGVLKAVGWSTGDVLAARLFEALVVALGATTAGALGAYGYVFWLGAPGLRDALLGWSTLQPRFALTPSVTVTQLLTLASLVAAPYLAASVIPAWRAATLDPADSLRE